MSTLPLTASAKSAVSQLFSSSVIRELALKGRSPLFARLIKETRLYEQKPLTGLVRDAFDNVFSVLRLVGNRDEYIYRAALTHNVLLGRHSLKSASMLAEFRVGDCRADLAILNGAATVYEIKSERDTLSRLDNQIQTYRRFFARIYVIAGENHVEAVLRHTPENVGVLRLSSRQQISTVREAATQIDQICPLVVLDSIRTNEAKLILHSLGIAVPEVPNTLIRSHLREIFRSLPPDRLHCSMLSVLKRTRNLLPLSQLVEDLPPSLTAAALTVPLKKADHERLVSAVNTRLEEAVGWGGINVSSVLSREAVRALDHS